MVSSTGSSGLDVEVDDQIVDEAKSGNGGQQARREGRLMPYPAPAPRVPIGRNAFSSTELRAAFSLCAIAA
jgi:hypothetical protein